MTHFEDKSAATRKPYALCTIRAWSRRGRKFLDCGIPLLTELHELRPDNVQVRNFWSKPDFVRGTYLCFSLSVCICSLFPVWANLPIFVISFGRYGVESISVLNPFRTPFIWRVSWRLRYSICGNFHTYAHQCSWSWSVHQQSSTNLYRSAPSPFVLKDSSWGKMGGGRGVALLFL